MKWFVGLDIPEAIRRELVHVQEQLRRFDTSANYEPAENFHLTLRYIGETANVEPIAAGLERIEWPAFRLGLRRLGMFHNPDRNVVWVDVRDEGDNLRPLRNRIDGLLALAGVPADGYSFVPHISLAYDCRPSLSDHFSSCSVAPLTFVVDRFYLFAVHPASEGNRFAKSREFPLIREGGGPWPASP